MAALSRSIETLAADETSRLLRCVAVYRSRILVAELK